MCKRIEEVNSVISAKFGSLLLVRVLLNVRHNKRTEIESSCFDSIELSTVKLHNLS